MSKTLNNIALALRKQGLKADRLTQSDLIVQLPIQAGNTSYQFAVLQSVPPVLPDEIRLALQDLFFVNAMGIFLSATATVGGVAQRFYISAPPLTLGAAAAPLFSLYRGNLNVSINNVTYIQNWSVQRHFANEETQFTPFSAGVAATLPKLLGNQTAFARVNPNFVFNGNSKIDVVLNLADNTFAPVAGLQFTDAAGVNVPIAVDRVGIIFRGILGQNSSNINK